jgi:hypothetical protein
VTPILFHINMEDRRGNENMSDEPQHTQDIISILSKLPEFLRESMMRSRLQELCAGDSETREEIIDSILAGLDSADTDSLTKVVGTWLEVVSGLESRDISTIFASYIDRLEQDPSLGDSAYFTILFDAFQALDEDRRKTLRDCLVEVILNHPKSRQLIYRLPDNVLSALDLR